MEGPQESKSYLLERFVGPVSPPESSRRPNRLLSQIYRPSVDVSPGLLFPANRLANKKCQRNRFQNDDGKKTNACQCEHLRHRFPSLHASHGGAVTRLSFLSRRGIEPEKDKTTRCPPEQSRARSGEDKVSIDPTKTQAPKKVRIPQNRFCLMD